MEQDHANDKTTSEPIDISTLPDFAKNILEHAETIPQEALDEFPSDYTENLDHYLYGMPKKSQGPSDSAALEERNDAMENTQMKKEAAGQPDDLGMPSIQKKILERAARLPKQDLEVFPPDFTENLDHYLYGMPKKTQ